MEALRAKRPVNVLGGRWELERDVERRYVVGRAQKGLALLFSGFGESSSIGSASAPRASPCRFECDMVPVHNRETVARAVGGGGGVPVHKDNEEGSKCISVWQVSRSCCRVICV